MITKPTLKPMRGYVEVERGGKRMYRNVKTGEIVAPRAAIPAPEKTANSEILNILLGVTDDDE